MEYIVNGISREVYNKVMLYLATTIEQLKVIRVGYDKAKYEEEEKKKRDKRIERTRINYEGVG